MKLAVFIDYDNLLEPQKSSGIFDVTRKALLQMPKSSFEAHGTCDVRIYGGWYEDSTLTRLAQSLVVSIGDEFPAIIRVLNGAGVICQISATAELAVASMEEPSYHLFGTYRKKGRPSNLRVESPARIGCVEPSCPLPIVKKVLKNGVCSNAMCVVGASNLVYRHEQKIVDTMLACDMVFAPTQNYDHLVLISGDDDFLPPLRSVLLRGTPVSRFHPKPNANRRPISVKGTVLTEMDL
jgi:uncharacterized LabA/DUF88 family protein